MEERYFYHSFPRRKASDTIQKGLSILRLIAESGLLLTPEIYSFKEPLMDGTYGKEIAVAQKRICFTELSPSELKLHSKTFGEFSIEWDIESLRELGAIPVFYIPMKSSDNFMEGIGLSFLSRLADTQLILNRLSTLIELTQKSNSSEKIVFKVNDLNISESRLTIGGFEDLAAILQYQTRPIAEIVAALQAISGFFYPTENLKYTEILGYYRQREWRIVANMMRHGVIVTDKPTESERQKLIELDESFFNSKSEYATGFFCKVDQCQFLRNIKGIKPIAFARRIIVPRNAIEPANALLMEYELNLEVIGIDDL